MAIIRSAEKGAKQVDLSNEHSLPKSTVATIIANKYEGLNAFEEDEIKPERKKIRGSSFQDVEDALHTWYQQIMAKNVPVSGSLMMEKATQFASQLKPENFKASQGWFDNL